MVRPVRARCRDVVGDDFSCINVSGLSRVECCCPRTRFRHWRFKLYSYFNNIRVRSFVLNGAPLAYKTTNISVLDLFAGDGGLQDVPAANDPDGLVVDFDRVDDRADVALPGIGVRVIEFSFIRRANASISKHRY
jgi:hypothetical protein